MVERRVGWERRKVALMGREVALMEIGWGRGEHVMSPTYVRICET